MKQLKIIALAVVAATALTAWVAGTASATTAASGHATIDISAILNCGIFLSSSEWKGIWVVTSPHGLSVSA